ncbi:lipid II flippase Amj family protein [Novosphingobium album (ex Liu et al. 2023)]|uniref:Lipid II flippase Amj n=1 Tax=Novosphingobium album (ex Liu et al. 2023) TaxID=3031130 RepID=A0ABT5WQ00_9SPHN|nr:lipid II flippase Amj family protein [Novosphingobium album (ex Liu et al. 2023)]MDE8652117.1 lipid II flippase Amj family protein [Novosphingobium album (ex Liu et al. 2023)]
MDRQLIIICLLTAGINLIGTLAYAARIAGVRTGRIAMSFALFNMLVLVSRTSNSFLGPFLAKRIESRLATGGGDALADDFRVVLASATCAVFVGILLVPTGQRLFARAIGYFQRNRSTMRMILRTATPAGLNAIRQSVAIPKASHIHDLTRTRGVGWGVLAANVLAQALITVGVLASLYAGYLNPEYRVTASQLSAVINGFATILLFALIDPQLSVMTDDVVEGRIDAALFRRTIVWISLSRLFGTALAQLLFLPAAGAVAWIAYYV